jgi:hypothetical protein
MRVEILFLATERHQRRTWMLAAGLAVTLALSIGGTLTAFGVPVLPWQLLEGCRCSAWRCREG